MVIGYIFHLGQIQRLIPLFSCLLLLFWGLDKTCPHTLEGGGFLRSQRRFQVSGLPGA